MNELVAILPDFGGNVVDSELECVRGATEAPIAMIRHENATKASEMMGDRITIAGAIRRKEMPSDD